MINISQHHIFLNDVDILGSINNPVTLNDRSNSLRTHGIPKHDGRPAVFHVGTTHFRQYFSFGRRRTIIRCFVLNSSKLISSVNSTLLQLLMFHVLNI